MTPENSRKLWKIIVEAGDYLQNKHSKKINCQIVNNYV